METGIYVGKSHESIGAPKACCDSAPQVMGLEMSQVSSSGDPINSESLSPSGQVSTGTCQVSFPRGHSESLFCQASPVSKKTKPENCSSFE